MINNLQFILWRVCFGLEFKKKVLEGTWLEGFKYSFNCRDFFDEEFSPEDALVEEMSCWDG